MTHQKCRSLYLLRHGERMDYTFGNWIQNCFDQSGNYTPTDLNMPKTLPKRLPSEFLDNSPLTRVGLFQAEITGDAFKDANLKLTDVYCSPALRCVQTCDAFLKGCKKKEEIKIKIEPGLYEYMQVFSGGFPNLLTPEEYAADGYNIDLSYKPFLDAKKLDVLNEHFEQYFERCYVSTKWILDSNKCGDILFGVHGGNFEGCLRKLIGKKTRTYMEAKEILPKIPYCYFLQVQQIGDEWTVNKQPFPKFTHAGNTEYNQELLTK